MVLITTTITAVDWRLSLWGSYERQQGAITHLTLLLLFLLAAHRFQPLNLARPYDVILHLAGSGKALNETIISLLHIYTVAMITLGILEAPPGESPPIEKSHSNPF